MKIAYELKTLVQKFNRDIANVLAQASTEELEKVEQNLKDDKGDSTDFKVFCIVHDGLIERLNNGQ